jgi:putative FmdB family regulatory protein
MSRYEYRCGDHGPFDTSWPMGAAPGSVDCPSCGRPAARSFTAPLLRRTAKPLADLRNKEEKSSDQPEVVTAVPPKRRAAPSRTVDSNPLWSRLPRR